MSPPTRESRKSIIEAVKTPLNFLVLSLLVVDGTVGSLAIALKDFRAPLVWTVIVSIPAFVPTVVGLAVWRPGVLSGHSPLQAVHPDPFPSALLLALDGSFSKLQPIERVDAR